MLAASVSLRGIKTASCNSGKATANAWQDTTEAKVSLKWAGGERTLRRGADPEHSEPRHEHMHAQTRPNLATPATRISLMLSDEVLRRCLRLDVNLC